MLNVPRSGSHKHKTDGKPSHAHEQQVRESTTTISGLPEGERK